VSQDSEAHFSRDFEAMAHWQTALSRTIDLEGISNRDGFGYAVQISGGSQSRRRSWTGGLRLRKSHGSGDRDDRSAEEFKAGLEISHKTEVEVRHSVLPLRASSDAENNEKRRTSYSAKQAEYTVLDLDSKMDFQEPPTRGHTFLESSQSVDTLPTLPAPATHRQRDR
jgi:hypothetical protein